MDVDGTADLPGSSEGRDLYELILVASEVLDGGGDAADLVARLVSTSGEDEALRRLADVMLTYMKESTIRLSAAFALEGAPSWDDRRCPTCGALCDECVADAEGGIRDALADLGL